MALIQCRECGREISDQAATCPGCGAPPPKAAPAPKQQPPPPAPARKRPRWPWVMLGVLLLFGGCRACASCLRPLAELGAVDEPATPTAQRAPVEQDDSRDREAAAGVTAEGLCREFATNELRATTAHKGRYLNIKGRVADVGIGVMNDKYVTIRGEGMWSGVHCSLEKGQEDGAMHVSKGDEVILQGQVSGLTLGRVHVDRCRFVSRW